MQHVKLSKITFRIFLWLLLICIVDINTGVIFFKPTALLVCKQLQI